MKLTIVFFVFLFSASIQALEIQCHTHWDDTDFVVKTSESSGITYVLFLKGDQLEKYWALEDDSFESSDERFFFQDDQTTIDIKVGSEGVLISTPALFRDTEEIKLHLCLNTESE